MKNALFFVFVSMLLFPPVFAQTPFAPEFDKVTVEHHGSWQWGQEKTHDYTLAKQADGSMMIKEDFQFDLDDADERYTIIYHTFGGYGNIYRIEATFDKTKSDLTGDKWVDFTVFKSDETGKLVKRGTKKEKLPIYTSVLGSNPAKIDFSAEAGIVFDAQWKRFHFPGVFVVETDVEFYNVRFTEEEMEKTKNGYLALKNHAAITALYNDLAAINRTKRVIDLAIDFVPGFEQEYQGKKYSASFYGKIEKFNEEGTSLKERTLFITENKKIKFIILLENSIAGEDLLVFEAKPNAPELESLTDFSEVVDAVLSDKFVQLKGVKLDKDFWSGLSYVGGTAAAGGIGAGGVALYFGASLIFWPLGVAAVFGAASYGVYSLVNTDTYLYGGKLVINSDEEFFSRFEEKINFIFYLGGASAVISPPASLEED